MLTKASSMGRMGSEETCRISSAVAAILGTVAMKVVVTSEAPS